MARAKVIHSDDAVEIRFFGDKNRCPEPGTAVIKFPGGHVEVSRTTDGHYYWAHIQVVDPTNIVASRLDYNHEGWQEIQRVPDIPRASDIKHIAVQVRNEVKHFEP